ncbi:MAG TPA: adenylate/guanylate cyclase domain-containing protein, partial [Herpetosiphonaceae bacterium]
MISSAEPPPALLITPPAPPRWRRLIRDLTCAVLYQAGLWRAVAEAVLIGSLPLVLLTFSRLQGAGQQASTLDTFGTISVLVLALRVRHSEGGRGRRFRVSLGRVALLSLVMTACVMVWSFLWYKLGLINFREIGELINIGSPEDFEGGFQTMPLPVMLIIAFIAYIAMLFQNIGLFAVYRFGLALWSKLEYKRRHFLSWSITRAHLLTVAVALGIAFLVVMIVTGSNQNLPLSLLLVSLISDGLGFVVLLPVGLLLVLPPIAALSNLITRGMTQRLGMLVRATSAIRTGDYAARIDVQGEDEIAQLQHDFNTMAEELERAMRELRQQKEQLAAEKAKSEQLLLNILPKSIADQLKEEQRTIADSFSEATVLFADIVDFTMIASQLSATELVAWLNHIFSAFDQLADHFGLEKIKTIGDAYMVVGGLPAPRPDHADAVIRMAMAMQETVSALRTPAG